MSWQIVDDYLNSTALQQSLDIIGFDRISFQYCFLPRLLWYKTDVHWLLTFPDHIVVVGAQVPLPGVVQPAAGAKPAHTAVRVGGVLSGQWPPRRRLLGTGMAASVCTTSCTLLEAWNPKILLCNIEKRRLSYDLYCFASRFWMKPLSMASSLGELPDCTTTSWCTTSGTHRRFAY